MDAESNRSEVTMIPAARKQAVKAKTAKNETRPGNSDKLTRVSCKKVYVNDACSKLNKENVNAVWNMGLEFPPLTKANVAKVQSIAHGNARGPGTQKNNLIHLGQKDKEMSAQKLKLSLGKGLSEELGACSVTSVANGETGKSNFVGQTESPDSGPPKQKKTLPRLG